MKIILGAGSPGQRPDGEPDFLARVEQTTAIATRDYWLMVYDWVGTKVLDTVVRAKVFEYDDAGALHLGGAGNPQNQLFAIEEVRAEDAELLVAAITGQHQAQIAWKQVEDGTFERPPIEWVNHTNGLPNIGPLLVARWDRGETPDTMRTIRNRYAVPVLETMTYGYVGTVATALLALLAAIAAAVWAWLS